MKILLLTIAMLIWMAGCTEKKELPSEMIQLTPKQVIQIFHQGWMLGKCAQIKSDLTGISTDQFWGQDSIYYHVNAIIPLKEICAR